MSWQEEIPFLIRYSIGDVDAPQTYSNSRLELQTVVAAQFVNSELSMGYTVSMQTTGITPDPTDSSNRDDAFITLVSLKASCLLATNEARIRGGQSIEVVDGDSAVKLGGRGKIAQEIATNFCKLYEDAKWDYQTGQLGGNELARYRFVVSPFRFQQGGNEGGRSW